MQPTSSPPRAARRPAPGSFRNTLTLAHVRGVPVRVDLSWVLIAGLVTVYFFNNFSDLLGDRGGAAVVGAAVAAALLLFASVLAHEFGHAFTSLDRDIPVLSVTLFALGGVTESTREASSARDEFIIVGIGPFISLVLAGAFGLAYTASAAVEPVAVVFGYLAWVNLGLAVFNIAPGYPLDGGRLLRSVLWGVTGRRHAATRWAARVGQVFALGVALYGGSRVLRGDTGGLWEVFLGLFLLRGATDSHRRARLSERIAGRTARHLMGSVPATLPGDLPLDRALQAVQERPSLLWPVGQPLLGGVVLAQIDAVPGDQWATTPVRAVATPLDEISVDAGDDLDTVLERIADAPDQMLLVVDSGRPVGLLTPSLLAEPRP